MSVLRFLLVILTEDQPDSHPEQIFVLLYLWQAEQQRQDPGQHYEAVPALRGPAAVRLQGAADSVVAIRRHGHNHVGGGEHAEDLEVFHQAAQEVGAGKAALSVPHELG